MCSLQVQSACFSWDGEVVVVGTVTGKWLALDSRTRQLHCVHQDTGGEPVATVKATIIHHQAIRSILQRICSITFWRDT